MLAVSSLMSATSAVVNMFSPSKNPCMTRVAGTRFRYNPYGACVLPQSSEVAIAESPTVRAVCRAVAKAVPACPSPLESVLPVAMSPQTLKAPASVPRYAFVQFKHETTGFIAPFRVTAGDTVVVEGDRGENIGIVSEVTTKKPTHSTLAKLLRRATKKDLETLAAQREKEANALATTQALAKSVRMNAVVEDVEMQFDMNKMTVFVRRASKSVFVDFRKLQRGLFREFRCRIWLSYMDEVEAAQAAPQHQ